MVMLNMESRKLTGRMYTENRFKNAKAVVVKGLKLFYKQKKTFSRTTSHKW